MDSSVFYSFCFYSSDAEDISVSACFCDYIHWIRMDIWSVMEFGQRAKVLKLLFFFFLKKGSREGGVSG